VDATVLKLKLSHLGLPRTVAFYLGRLAYRLLGLTVYWLVALEPAGATAPRTAVADLQLAAVDTERLRREALDPAIGLPAARLAVELGKEDLCLGAFVGGSLASYVFVTETSTRLEDLVRVRFEPSWAFCRWAFTREDYRGRHLYPVLKRRALDVQVERGRRGLLSLIGVHNFESLRAAARLGSRQVGLVAAARVGGRVLVWSSRGCAAYGVSLERDLAG